MAGSERLRDQYRRMPTGAKLALWLVLLSQLPLVYLFLNNASVDFCTDACPYQHMHMIDRVAQGLPVYSPLSTDHAAVTYTPLYWWVNGWLFRLLGPSFLLPRLVSLFSSLVFAAVIFLFVREGTEGNLVMGVAAPALVLLTSAMSGYNGWAWDINVNALHVALVALGFFVLRKPGSMARSAAAAALLSAALLAKQTGLAYVAAAAVLLLIQNRKCCAVFVMVCAAVLGSTFLYLNVTTSGEFFRQVITANQGPPWLLSRLFNEVFLTSFVTAGGIFTFGTFILLLSDLGPNWLSRLARSEYFFCASGMGVAAIAHPKFGSGPVHDILALAGLAICGCIGLHRLLKRVDAPLADRLRTWLPVLQIVIALMLIWDSGPSLLVDDVDRAKNAEISRVFQAGRTCLFGVPYIQRFYGQPLGGYPDDEPSKWRNGRLDYSALPPELSDPFINQVYDYVILGPYIDTSHPVVKAIMKNYASMAGKLPKHPDRLKGGAMRTEMYILRANRLSAGQQPPTTPTL